jgi:general secretion pathway protein J
MATLAYSGLRTVISTSSGVQRQIKRLESLQRCMMFIERDIRQMVARPVNTDVAKLRNAVELSATGQVIIEFTRAGQPNPAGLTQSGLQRVGYHFQEGVLTRHVWGLVDHLQDEEPVEMKLMDQLNKVEFRLLDKSFKWQTGWGEKKEQLEEIPVAVEVTLDHKQWGIIRRLIPVYGF